jgi:hypothetical protein
MRKPSTAIWKKKRNDCDNMKKNVDVKFNIKEEEEVTV